MIRTYCLIASIALVSSVSLWPVEADHLSEKAKLVIQELRYEGPDVNPSDYNTANLYVRATVVYGGDETIINPDSRIIAACAMNTEKSSAEKPGKQWWDWRAHSCFNNDHINSPDFPHQCGEHQIDKKLSETRRLGCQAGAPDMPRCFQSTKPNRFIGWASGGARNLTDDLGYDDVAVRQALPPGEIPCRRHFELQGRVEGLEQGDQLQFHADLPNPATGAVEAWDVTIQPSTGTLLNRKNGSRQIADGASYKARVAAQPEKKSCTFNNNSEMEIQGTFVNVDDRGRTAGGKDLTDLSITCVCRDGQQSCPPDGVLNVEATGLEAGESATVAVTIQHPSGGEVGSGAFPIPSSGTWTIVSNIPQGSSFSVTFNSFAPLGKTCVVANGSGTMGPEGAVVQLSCSCPSATGSSATGGSVTAAATACPPPGRFEDLIPVNQIDDLCQFFDALCPRLDPWWWAIPGPATGPAPCQRQTVCVDGPPSCWTDPQTGKTYCGPTLNCYDQCLPQSWVVLQGPYLGIDGFDQPVGGRVLVSGFASDADSVAGLRFYLDGAPLVLDGFDGEVFRPEACGPIDGDCDPFAGFRGELDTGSLSDGLHRLVVVAVDANPRHPVPTFREIVFQVSNACASTAPPTGSLLLPAAGATVAGTVLVEAQAAAENGVERVRFYLDGSRVSTDWTPPYRWSWATTGVPDGSHAIHADVLDTCGNVTTTASRTVTVANANDAPELALEAPTPLLRLSGVAAVSGWAVDIDGIESVSLRLGTQVLPLSSPITWMDRADVCSGSGVADPRCPRVGWQTSFDTALWPDGHHTFQVVVVDRRGASAEKAITLSIRNAPIASPTVSTPVSRTVVEGEDVSFTVSVSGEGPFTYRWQYRSGTSWLSLADGERGGRVTGTATAKLSIADVVAADQASYRCVVENEGGATASSAASLTVHDQVAPPTVTTGLDQRVVEGDDAYLQVTAQGVGPLIYQWQKLAGSWVDLVDDGRIGGTKADMLTILGATSADGGQYRVRVSNEAGTTDSSSIALSVDPVPVGTCQETSTTLCFQSNRFAVSATVNGGSAWALPFSEEGGFFWMFEPNTVEVAIKILDGTGANGHFWVFHGSLTDLAYTVTVTDTMTGASKTYLKDAGHFCGEGDTTAFHGSTTAPSSWAGYLVPLAPSRVAAEAGTPCASSGTLACLLGGKFAVEVLKNASPQAGLAVTDLSASFGFVTATAPEVVVKVIDGTSVNNYFWLFFGSLTHQDFTVRVTDSATGEYRTYASPGQFCGGADTTAF